MCFLQSFTLLWFLSFIDFLFLVQLIFSLVSTYTPNHHWLIQELMPIARVTLGPRQPPYTFLDFMVYKVHEQVGLGDLCSNLLPWLAVIWFLFEFLIRPFKEHMLLLLGKSISIWKNEFTFDHMVVRFLNWHWSLLWGSMWMCI